MSLLVIAATMNVMADMSFTAKAKITLTGGGESCEMFLVQSDELSAGVNDYCQEMRMEGRVIALYALDGTKLYQSYCVKDLGNLAFGFMTTITGETTYTVTVSEVGGADLYMKDNVTNETHKLSEGATWTFNASASSDTRFALAAAPAPAVPGICHQNGRLEFTAYEGASVQVVGYDDNTVVAVPATDITLAYQEIDLADLAAGQYLVIVTKADQTEEKLVIKK